MTDRVASRGLPPLELRSERWWQVPMFAGGCLVFVAVGVALILVGLRAGLTGFVLVPLGLLSIVFFGGLLILQLPDQLRGRRVRLDVRGIAISRAGETLTLPWSQVVDVRVVTLERNHIVGLLLRDPARAAREAPAAATGGGGAVRWLVAGTGAGMRRVLPGSVPGDPGSASTAAGMLAYNRESFGFDVGLGWADRDRPADELLELIERYRAHAATP